MPRKAHPRWFENACRKSIASSRTLLRSLSLQISLRGKCCRSSLCASSRLRSACTMKLSRTLGRRNAQPVSVWIRSLCTPSGQQAAQIAVRGRQENETKKSMENRKRGSRGLSRARPRGAEAPLQWSSPISWNSRQLFTPPVFSGSCTRAASLAAS